MHPNHLCVELRSQTWITCISKRHLARTLWLSCQYFCFFARATEVPLRPNMSPVRPTNLFFQLFCKNKLSANLSCNSVRMPFGKSTPAWLAFRRKHRSAVSTGIAFRIRWYGCGGNISRANQQKCVANGHPSRNFPKTSGVGQGKRTQNHSKPAEVDEVVQMRFPPWLVFSSVHPISKIFVSTLNISVADRLQPTTRYRPCHGPPATPLRRSRTHIRQATCNASLLGVMGRCLTSFGLTSPATSSHPPPPVPKRGTAAIHPRSCRGSRATPATWLRTPPLGPTHEQPTGTLMSSG